MAFFLMGWDWVHLVLRPLFGLLCQPQMIDGDCGTIGGMWIGRGNWSTRRKLAPIPLCPPQIPHVLTQARARAAPVGSRRLTAWAMARPFHGIYWYFCFIRNISLCHYIFHYCCCLVYSKKQKVKLYLYRPWRPLGLLEVEAPTFSDIRLKDGGKVVSPTRRPLFTHRKIPGTHFC
jgi:hypothetical protein